MSVYKPAKSRFWQYDFVIEGLRFHGSTGQTTRRAAEKAEERKRREVGEGKYGSAENLTLNQACGAWWDDVGQHRGDAVDVERRLEMIQRLIPPSTRLADIDAETVAAAIRKRRLIPYQKSNKPDAKLYMPTPATVNRDIIEHLRPAMRYAAMLFAKRGLKVQPIPWGKLRLEEPAGLVKVYAVEEQVAWRAECGPTTGLALDLLLTYGPRFGELFFELADFDPEGPRLNIRSRLMPDGSRRRGRKRDTGAHVLPLKLEHAREIAARVARARAAELEHIWYVEVKNEKTGAISLEPLTYYSLQGRLNSAAERAKVSPGRRIHGTRHHAGTAILRKSGNLKLSQRLLGHANIQSTMRYAHALEEDLRAAIEQDDSSPRNSPGAKRRTSGATKRKYRKS